MNFLKVNLLNIVRHIDDIDDFHNLCRTNKEIFKICKYYSNIICKYFLDIFNVSYTHDRDFIYVMNYVNKEDYIDENGIADYKKIYLLYYNF